MGSNARYADWYDAGSRLIVRLFGVVFRQLLIQEVVVLRPEMQAATDPHRAPFQRIRRRVFQVPAVFVHRCLFNVPDFLDGDGAADRGVYDTTNGDWFVKGTTGSGITITENWNTKPL